MKAACIAVVLAGACLCSGQAWGERKLSDSEWTSYRNARFGFSLHYPARVFGVQTSSEAGDGRLFATKDEEARLLVGAFSNADQHNVASYADYILRRSYPQYTLTYQRTGETWFVVSGQNENTIFYEKAMFTCGGRLISSFALIYPITERAKFDPIVEGIEDLFRPATECAAGRRRTAKTRVQVPAAASGSRMRAAARVRAPHSALADRIARDRGRDVLVILRRTGPPYDRKVVRGYVSR